MLHHIYSLIHIGDKGHFPKEILFNWIVDLDQTEFNTLCNEVIALYAFQAKYDGLLVTDEVALIRPYLSVLSKVAFAVEDYRCDYDKKHFYRILSVVSEEYVDRVCQELSALLEHVWEHANTWIINGVSHEVPNNIQAWKVTFYGKPLTKYFSSVINSWHQTARSTNV